MRVRLTPLNIILAALITAFAYFLVFPDESGWRVPGTVSLLAFGAICFVTDMIFRYFIKDLKRIWIVEVCFLIFAVVLIVILKR